MKNTFKFNKFLIISFLTVFLITLWAISSQGAPSSVKLSQDDSAWLEAHSKSIRLGADHSWPPFEYQKINGEFAGLCQEYANIVAKRLGIQFNLLPGMEWSEILSGIKSRDIDVSACVPKTKKRDNFMAFTKPFSTIPMVIFTRDDFTYINGLDGLHESKIAVLKDSVETEYLLEKFPNFTYLSFDNSRQAVQTVATGQADAFVGSLAVGVYYIRKMNLANVKVAAPADIPPVEIRFGFRKDWARLAAITDKVLDTITPKERSAIEQHWISIKYDPLVDYGLLWKTGGSLSALLILAILWVRQVQRQKHAIQASEAKLTTQNKALKKLTQDLESYGKRVASELKMATETQAMLLPDVSVINSIHETHDLHIESLFEPCSELGGDFWGVIDIDTNRVALLMVDFSGHGINAALNTFRLHSLLRSENKSVENPAHFLEHLNKQLLPLLPGGQFATMFYGIIDRSKNLLTYAGAATPNPFLFLPNQKEPLIGNGSGFPLGLFDKSTYENHTLPFPEGASLLLYSDAAIEGKLLSSGRLEQKGLVDIAVDCLNENKSENLVELLSTKLYQIMVTPLVDDLTIVCATRKSKISSNAFSC